MDIDNDTFVKSANEGYINKSSLNTFQTQTQTK